MSNNLKALHTAAFNLGKSQAIGETNANAVSHGVILLYLAAAEAGRDKAVTDAVGAAFVEGTIAGAKAGKVDLTADSLKSAKTSVVKMAKVGGMTFGNHDGYQKLVTAASFLDGDEPKVKGGKREAMKKAATFLTDNAGKPIDDDAMAKAMEKPEPKAADVLGRIAKGIDELAECITEENLRGDVPDNIMTALVAISNFRAKRGLGNERGDKPTGRKVGVKITDLLG